MASSAVNPNAPSTETRSPELKNAAYFKTYSTRKFILIEVVLRFLLFATTLTSLLLILTGKQTELMPIPFPPYKASVSANYDDSPAFIYFIVAVSVTCLYSIITTILAFFPLIRPAATSRKFMSYLVIIDLLLVGIVASAGGAAGEVAYIGLKGNSHIGWRKVCNVYGHFCRHTATSIFVSSIAAMELCCLVMLYITKISSRRNNHN